MSIEELVKEYRVLKYIRTDLTEDEIIQKDIMEYMLCKELYALAKKICILSNVYDINDGMQECVIRSLEKIKLYDMNYSTISTVMFNETRMMKTI